MAVARSVNRQILLNTLTGWGYKLLKVGVALVTNPLLIAGLGREDYALITLLSTLVGFSELTDLGVRPALGRELAAARAKQDMAETNRLVNSAFLAYGVWFFVLSFSVWVATPWVASLLAGKSKTLTSEAVWLLRSYGIFALAIAFTRPVFSAVLASANRFDYRNRAESIFTLLQGGGLVAVLLLTDWKLAGWVLVACASQAFNLGQIIYLAFKAQPGLIIHPKFVKWLEIKRLYSFGSVLFLSQWAKKIKFDADPIIIARFLNLGMVALYKPASSLMANIRPLLVTFAGQLYPVTTHYFAQKDTENIRALFFAGSRFTILLAIPVALFFGMYGREVMQLWLGGVLTAREISLAGQVLAGWACIELAVSLEGSAWAILFGMRRVRFIILIEIVAAILNVSASIYLITQTSLGIMAVVYPSIVLEGIIRPIYALYAGHRTGIRPMQILSKIYMRPALVGVALFFLVITLKRYVPAEGWGSLGLHGTILALAFLGIAWLVGLTGAEKSKIQSQIKARIGKI